MGNVLKENRKREGNQETFIANIKKFIVHLIEHVPDDVQKLNFHTYQAEVKKKRKSRRLVNVRNVAEMWC